jgi:phage FluMu gp28-like protein
MAIIGKLWTPDERLNYIYNMIKVDMKNVELDFYQDELIRSNATFLAILKARQIGWSFLVALKGLAMANDPARIKYTKQFVSYNEEDAQEKIRYAKEFYESIPNRFKKKLKRDTTTSMEFIDQGGKTTSRLISIACRPPRGKNGDISFDEMAFYPANRCKAIYTAGVNAIARGGHIEVGSTPLGTIGMFYDILTNEHDYEGYDRYTVPWWFSRFHCNDVEKAVALAPDMPTEQRVFTFGTKKLISIYKTNLLEDFQQEQECMFIDSKGSFISLELIYANTPGMRPGERENALESDDAEEEGIEIHVAKTALELTNIYDPEKHGALYLGYDVARRRDAAVIFAIGNNLKTGKKISLAEIEMRDTPFEEQLNTLRSIISSLSPVRCCIDQTGMGEPLCERMQKEFGEERIEGVPFTNETKEILANNVKRGLESLDFLLPNSQAFHLQIHSIKRMPTLMGRFRYDAERTDKGHADSFWAWALAYHAITITTERTPNYWEERARKKNGDALQSKQEKPPTEAAAHNLTTGRGKSLNSVLRGIENNAYKTRN